MSAFRRCWAAIAVLLFAGSGYAGQMERIAESEGDSGTGKQVFVSNCSFCHGSTARGGAQGGPDLTQSALVRGDRDGEQLGAFLKVGRPDKGMPAFNLPNASMRAIAQFLHSSGRHPSLGTRVLVGDAAAGKTFFEGEGNCVQCHSLTGDLRAIGTKYPPATLQGRLVLPIGKGGYPGLSRSESSNTKVTLRNEQGRTLSGRLVYLSDYAVTLVDSEGEQHTIVRHGGNPSLLIQDPLQAHLDRQLILTDKQMHDLTAYLSRLE